MSTTPVVAIFKAKPGSEETVEAFFRSVIEPTHAEDGCISYQLNRDVNDPARFVWTEEWETRASLDAHLVTEHIKTLFNEKLPGHIETEEVIILTPLAGMK